MTSFDIYTVKKSDSSELIYQHSYSSEDKLFADIDDYVLLWYNSVRPHSFNNGLTPWQKRMA